MFNTMLNYKLINLKPTITNNNVTYVDLLSKTYLEDTTYYPDIAIVNEHYVARPDLISLAKYRDDSYADIICKLNGISNPFELNEDEVLILPNSEYMFDCIKQNRVASDIVKDPKNDYIQPIDKHNKQKKKNERRSPNEQVIGDSNYIVDKSLGIIFY